MQTNVNLISVVWISHPVSGNVERNLERIARICERVHRKGYQPLFPSFTSRRYRRKLSPKESETQVRVFFESLAVSEVWLFGRRITPGMLREIHIAKDLGIDVIAKTESTRKALRELRL